MSREFLVLVLISLPIAIPVSWFYLQGWLQQFNYRKEMNWWLFESAGAGALVVTNNNSKIPGKQTTEIWIKSFIQIHEVTLKKNYETGCRFSICNAHVLLLKEGEQYATHCAAENRLPHCIRELFRWRTQFHLHPYV